MWNPRTSHIWQVSSKYQGWEPASATADPLSAARSDVAPLHSPTGSRDHPLCTLPAHGSPFQSSAGSPAAEVNDDTVLAGWPFLMPPALMREIDPLIGTCTHPSSLSQVVCADRNRDPGAKKVSSSLSMMLLCSFCSVASFFNLCVVSGALTSGWKTGKGRQLHTPRFSLFPQRTVADTTPDELSHACSDDQSCRTVCHAAQLHHRKPRIGFIGNLCQLLQLLRGRRGRFR